MTVRDSQRKRGTHPLEARIEFPLGGGARRATGSALATWPSPRGRDGLPHVRDPASRAGPEFLEARGKTKIRGPLYIYDVGSTICKCIYNATNKC